MERLEAEEIYRNNVTSMQAGVTSKADPEVLDNKNKMNILLVSFLSSCQPNERFRFKEFPYVLEASTSDVHFHPEKAKKSFEYIEKYLCLLVMSPWKREFYSINKFGGYYQSHIATQLKNVESVFRLVGFSEHGENLVLHRQPPVPDVLLSIGFECLVAAAECKIILKIWKHLGEDRENYSLKDVVHFRMKNAGSDRDIALMFEKSFSKPVVKRGSFRSRLKEHMKAFSENIPFIDDDGDKPIPEPSQTEGTLDDHLMASLQLVNEDDVVPKLANASQIVRHKTPASDEWSFVREGLERNYGKKYFEGPRPDFLEEKEDESNVETNDKPLVNSSADRSRLQRKIARIGPTGPTDSVNTSSVSDSGYQTYYVQGAQVFMPPEIPSAGSGHPLLARASKQTKHSETEILHKKNSSVILNEDIPSRPQAVTAPILRRGDSEPVTPGSRRGRFSQSMPAAPLPSSNNIADGFSNIKAHLKRSSVPTVTKETVIPGPMAFQAQSFVPAHSKYDVKGIRTPPEEKILTGWACQFCTYLNNPYSLVCELCSKSRDGHPEIDAPSVGDTSRVCEKCTLDNNVASERCQACGSKLKGSQTVV